MKKTVPIRISKALAAFTLKAAKAGAGFQSLWGWHQPRVPKRISK